MRGPAATQAKTTLRDRMNQVESYKFYFFVFNVFFNHVTALLYRAYSFTTHLIQLLFLLSSHF